MAHAYFLMKLPGEPDRVLVWDTRTLTIGRSPDNAVVLDETEVSRRHATLTKEKDAFTIGDHQTGNGTFVDGQGISGTVPFGSGAVITVGKLQLEFCVSDEHPAKRGMKLDYASHLMTSGMAPQPGSNPDSTMVGLMDPAPGDDDEFVIEHNDGGTADLFADDTLGLDLVEPAPVRDLDLDVTGGSAPATAKAAPGPDPNDSQFDPVERMRRLKSLHAEGLITDEEFERKRAEVLNAV